MPFVVRDATVENQRMIHVVKKRDVASRVTVKAHEDHDARIMLTIPQSDIELAALGSMHLPVILSVAKSDFMPGMRAHLVVAEEGGDEHEITIEVLGPRAARNGATP